VPPLSWRGRAKPCAVANSAQLGAHRAGPPNGSASYRASGWNPPPRPPGAGAVQPPPRIRRAFEFRRSCGPGPRCPARGAAPRSAPPGFRDFHPEDNRGSCWPLPMEAMNLQQPSVDFADARDRRPIHTTCPRPTRPPPSNAGRVFADAGGPCALPCFARLHLAERPPRRAAKPARRFDRAALGDGPSSACRAGTGSTDSPRTTAAPSAAIRADVSGFRFFFKRRRTGMRGEQRCPQLIAHLCPARASTSSQ